MMADGADECRGRVAAHQCLDDRRFGQARIFQSGMNHARLRIEQKGCGNPSRGAMRQREPLALRESFQAVDERFLGQPFLCRRERRA